MLRDVPAGGYRFVPGISAFSSGVVATSGWEIVHATLAAPVPWRDGFACVDRHLRETGRPRAALCGIELRSPAPFSFGGFDGEVASILIQCWSLTIFYVSLSSRSIDTTVAASSRVVVIEETKGSIGLI